MLGPLLFLIYVNDLDTGITSRISKFADDTKMAMVIEAESDRVGLQEDLDRLHEWSLKWLMFFNAEKCKVPVLRLGRPDLDEKYKLNNTGLDNSECEKDLGVLVSCESQGAKIDSCIFAHFVSIFRIVSIHI